MIHFLYILSIVIVIAFSQFGVRATLSNVVAATPKRKCEPRRSESSAVGLALNEEKIKLAENNSAIPILKKDFSPRDLLNIIPEKDVFDPEKIFRHSHIDLSNYREAQLMEESENTITYKYIGPNGHEIERTTQKATGRVTYETWDDSDGKITRAFYELGYNETFIDKAGNSYQYVWSHEGTKTLVHRDSSGLTRNIDYDKEGKIVGVLIEKSDPIDPD